MSKKSKRKRQEEEKRLSDLSTIKVQEIQNVLECIIESIAMNKDLYVKHPGKDFSRKSILSLKSLIHLMLNFSNKNMSGEIADFFDVSGSAPTEAAVLNRRSLLSEAFFIDLYKSVTMSMCELQPLKTLLGYLVLACDGSEVAAPAAKEKKKKKKGEKKKEEEECDDLGLKPFREKAVVNGAHKKFTMNAMYDVMNHIFTDLIIEEGDSDERHQALEMIKRSSLKNVIALFDRGYESWELMAQCIEKGWRFLIRAKDIGSNGICSGLSLPSTPEFDEPINITLVNRQTKEIKIAIANNPNSYKYVNWSNFSLFPQNPRLKNDNSIHEFRIDFRIVRIEIGPGEYEVLFTNLPQDQFSPEKLKELYWMRWNIEVGFRRIKYIGNLVRIHSVKTNYIIQELYTKFTVFNIASTLINVTKLPEPKKSRKYQHQIKFTAAYRSARALLRGSSPVNIVEYLQKNHEPIKPKRTFERRKYPRSPQPFNARSA